MPYRTKKEVIPHALPDPPVITRKYGWVKKERDIQHHIFSVSKTQPAITKVDLRPFCPPIYDQGQLGACFPAQTHILTENGWILFSNLSGTERLATVNPETSKLIYEMPTRLIAFDYEGDLIIGKNKTSLDFAVTPDHKMLVRTSDTPYKFVGAKDLGWKSDLLTNIVWNGDTPSDNYVLPGNRTVAMKPWLRFLGLFHARGILYNEIELRIRNKERPFVRELLKELNLDYLEEIGKYVIDDPIFNVLNMKKIPPMVFKQSADNIKEFLLGYSLSPNSFITDPLASDIQLLVFLAGETSYIKNNRLHRIKSTTINKQTDIKRAPYSGMVYCAEVPTYHTLITKHNGKILISSNCTANAIAAAYEFDEIKQKETSDFRPSRLFIYWGERSKEGTLTEDAGADISDGINFINTVGVCPESVPENNTVGITGTVCWPYDIAKFTQRPPDQCFTFASKHKTLQARAVQQNLGQLKQALIDGYPITLGVNLYASFESADVTRTGLVPMPSLLDRARGSLGGHATLICGFDDNMMVCGEKGAFIVRNSWGTGWGIAGYCFFPYKYVLDSNLSSDLWCITIVSDTY